MRSLKVAAYAAALLYLLSCATAPTADEIAAADYGPYPEAYEQIVKTHMGQLLKDPYSAQYEFLNMPTKGWHQFGGRAFGWVVCANINAKNGFGAYTGAKPYYFLVKSGHVVKQFGGGSDYTQSLAYNGCKTLTAQLP